MPLMDGFEFVERLRRLPGQAESPVFFITGRTSPADHDRAVHLGVRQYFEKPVDPDLLVQALDRVCLGNGANRAHGLQPVGVRGD
jgi:two-component system chemotaxis response regulator CheY